MKTKPEKTKSEVDYDAEFSAMQQMTRLLEPFEKQDRIRLLETVAVFFSIRL